MSAEIQNSLSAKALEVYGLLIKTYGERPLKPRREPMHELISTMLSHRTTEQNEALAYERMWERFGSWAAIRDAPLDELTEAITPSNFPGTKAPNIKIALTRIYDERGEYSIEFLRDLPLDQAMAWLMALPGVGIKTASLVMLFCFNKPILPVDTHVHRVSQRIGLIGSKVGTEAAHHILLALLPNDQYILFNFHISALRHGQRLCVWGDPKCAPCSLKHLCNWYQENVAGKA